MAILKLVITIIDILIFLVIAKTFVNEKEDTVMIGETILMCLLLMNGALLWF